jgi:DNA-binding NtrC family response regulator
MQLPPGVPKAQDASFERAAPMSSSKRILVVEDEAMILMDLEETLLGLGYSVVSSTTVGGAEASLESGDFDLAVIDFHLRDGTSADLARKLAGRGIPFILCTGTARSDELREVSQRTVFLEKPYTSEGLLDAVKTAFESGYRMRVKGATNSGDFVESTDRNPSAN